MDVVYILVKLMTIMLKWNLVIFLFIPIAIPFSSVVRAQNASWKKHVIDSSLSGADGVRLADVNNDNLMDIATGWEEGGYTKVYLHPGYPLVKLKWPSVIVGKTPDVEDAVFMDIDHDGRMDVVSSTEGKNRKVYINWAPTRPDDYLDASSWQTQVLSTSNGLMQWMYALPAQIDGIHGLDLVVGAKGHDAKIGWFEAPENPKHLSAWAWHTVSSATWVMSLLLSDMDYDGDMDIVVSDRKPGTTNGVRWLENPGNTPAQKQLWNTHFIGAENLEVMFIDMSDVDGDGLEDVIVAERTNQTMFYIRRVDRSGLSWKSHQIAIPEIAGLAKAVKVGDIDGDGNPDLVLSTNTLAVKDKIGIIWMSFKNTLWDSEWEWRDISGGTGYKFDLMELLDIDGDGDLDVLTCEENYGASSKGLGVIWYENPYGTKSADR